VVEPSAPSLQEDLGVTDEMIRGVMTQDGPIVQVVLLKADGSAEEHALDMTPKERNIEPFMGGQGVSIVGGFDDLGLVVRCLLDPLPHSIFSFA
jgi:hypothetical protein